MHSSHGGPDYNKSHVSHEVLPPNFSTGLCLGRVFSIYQERIDYGSIYNAKEQAHEQSVDFSAAAKLGAHLIKSFSTFDFIVKLGDFNK